MSSKAQEAFLTIIFRNLWSFRVSVTRIPLEQIMKQCFVIIQNMLQRKNKQQNIGICICIGQIVILNIGLLYITMGTIQSHCFCGGNFAMFTAAGMI